jgi:hypothetical protein
MDKEYISYFSNNSKNINIECNYNLTHNNNNFMLTILHYLKSCYYNGEIDKFIKYINHNLPEVNINFNLVLST